MNKLIDWIFGRGFKNRNGYQRMYQNRPLKGL